MQKAKDLNINNINKNKNKKQKADIFIPTSNRFDSLKKCLDSLKVQSNKNFNVLIVGLKPNYKIRKLIESYTTLNINYFIQKEPGLINAANEALNISENPIFVRTDDDVTFDKNWFESLVSRFDSDKNIGGVTGPTIISKEGLKSRDLTKYLENFKYSNNLVLKLLSKVYFNYLYENKINNVSTFLKSGVFTLGSNYNSCLSIAKPVEVNNLEACNFCVRTKLLKQIEGFDLVYTKGLGDYHEADAALKIKNLGYKLIFDSKVKVNHNVEQGHVSASRKHSYYRIQNFIIFYFRFFKMRSVDQFFRFLVNIIMQNAYYFYKFLTTKDTSNLLVPFGTVVGLFRALYLKFSS